MLSILLLLTNFATAQVACAPANDAKATNLAACGSERIDTYATKNQKVDTVTLVIKNDTNGAERIITVKKPGLTVEQINTGSASKSAAVNKEIAKVKKNWKVKNVRFEVSTFEVANATALYSTADLKTKASIDKIKKVNRNVASDTPPLAGGIRTAVKKK